MTERFSTFKDFGATFTSCEPGFSAVFEILRVRLDRGDENSDEGVWDDSESPLE